ncbi:hypothetical protein N0V91_004937 [Didymella pomorum]|uniref:Uncharacterized protein n=1 Tax=Didymella pomorum TaxID=749634 RepID=A0A9W8ZFD7_9PLEO|nr:hypothetical protein N0V91_004937 [Didymella pomorum]
MLNARSDWIDWYNSIEDLAKRNEVWKYCDLLGIENLVFTSTKPSDSASKDTIQNIFDSEKKKYDKVSDRINYTVCQEFKQHYLGKHDVRSKLIALSDSIQPNAKDQRQDIRTEFEKLRKGPSNTSLDNAKQYTIENLSKPQICKAFVEACQDINPLFYNYMKSKDAQTESQAITISFCIKQYRSMAPPSEKIARGRAAHATLQGRKHGRDPKTLDEEDGQLQQKQEAIRSSSVSAT